MYDLNYIQGELRGRVNGIHKTKIFINRKTYSDRISDDIPSQMKLLNTVIH